MVIDLADFENVEVVEELTIPLRRMPHNSVGSTFSVLQRDEGSLAAGTAAIVMHFKEKSRDAATGEVEEEGYEGDYDLEDLEVQFLSLCCIFCWLPPPRCRGFLARPGLIASWMRRFVLACESLCVSLHRTLQLWDVDSAVPITCIFSSVAHTSVT